MQFWQGFILRIFRLFFTTTDLVTQWVYRFSKGTLGHKQAGYNILLLTTVGRKSGKARTHALLYLKVEENWVVVASNGGNPIHPNWYFNLLSQPQATIQVGKLRFDVEACTVSDVERSILWQLLLDIWPAYANYQAGIQREIPILLLKPVKPIRKNGLNLILHRSRIRANVVK